jgi:hypothetical protein
MLCRRIWPGALIVMLLAAAARLAAERLESAGAAARVPN